MTLVDYFKKLPMNKRLAIAEALGCKYSVLYRNYIMIDKKTGRPAKQPRPERYQAFIDIFSSQIGEIAVHQHFLGFSSNSSPKRASSTNQ
ncbi:hypothetical protein V5030_14455 [Moellerella wisconsensis]|uniref:hypothetical protein n=1 Tax=Moellerella wisconsensis TaxID=158849 RepID=UPI001F4E8BB7|nr:hypothetical protein [Moellerella wisconsensis]UNH23130.1 hypothetical protein MNY68_09730 [Moellerella wisconsensis]